MKFDNTLMTCVRADLSCGLIPMLLGEPGIGKSSWLENLANLMQTKCFTLPCNQLADKADLTGARLVPIVDKDGNTVDYKQVFYPHAVIHDAIEYANEHPRENPILFFDELNRTTPDVTSEALSIPTMRSIGSKRLPDNLRIVIAGNDKGNVTTLDEASVSRFVLYRVEPDTDTFLGLDPNLNPYIKAVLQAHPGAIFGKSISIVSDNNNDDDNRDDADRFDEMFDEENMRQITTPRTISGLSRWLNSVDIDTLKALIAETRSDDPADNALSEIIEGHVGHTEFSVLLIAEIANNIYKPTAANATNLIISKPNAFDTLKSCATLDDLDDAVDELSEREKSACLIYAMYDRADHTRIIDALAASINQLDADDLKTILRLTSEGNIDKQNVSYMLSLNTNLSQSLSVLSNLM